jgi:hypothetical protein
MFLVKKPTPTESSGLVKAIDRLVAQMSETGCETKEYASMTDQLIKLTKLQEETTSKKRVSPDTLAMIVGNLAGIVLIIGYERTHIVTSKALGFVLKASR